MVRTPVSHVTRRSLWFVPAASSPLLCRFYSDKNVNHALKKCCSVLSFKQHLFTLLRVGCTLYFIVYLFVRFSKFVTLKTRFLWRGEGGFYIFVLDMLLTSMLHALSPACDLNGNLWFFVHAYARTHFALPDFENCQ